VLAAELDRVEEPGFSLEYASQIVVALKHVGTPQVDGALSGYVGRLEARMPDDPLARAYLQAKIDEAKDGAR
jgi:hypothetical protein